MKFLYENYPSFIPELKYAPEVYTKALWKGWKKKLVSKYWYKNKFDSDGLIYSVYKKNNRKYYPYNLNMGYAASNYNYYLKTDNEKYLKKFEKIVFWLSEKFYDYGKFGGWKNKHFIYGCDKPFLSSLTQGRGISLFIRALSIKNNVIYKEQAIKALKSYKISCEKGGILKKTNNNYWYLEYPCNTFDSVVLNGFVTSLTGPYDHFKYFNDNFSKEIFDKGVQTLKRNIGKFDLNLKFLKWTRYDNKKLFFATGNYHQTHIDQLKWLYNITGEKIFKKYAEKWSKYYKKYNKIAYWFEVPYVCYKKTGEKIW